MATSIHTPVGSAPIEKRRRYKKRPVSYAVVRITFRDLSDDEHVKVLEDRDYKVSQRSQITRQWLQDKVDEMLAGRDLEGLELQGVDAHVVESVWATPYDHIYPPQDS